MMVTCDFRRLLLEYRSTPAYTYIQPSGSHLDVLWVRIVEPQLIQSMSEYVVMTTEFKTE